MRGISTIFLLVILWGCKTYQETKPQLVQEEVANKSEPGQDEIVQKLIGTWEWIWTSCCFRMPKITTPDSVGYTKTLKFFENNKYELYINDSLAKKETFKVEHNFLNDNLPGLRLGEKHSAIVRFKGDTLVIDYGYMDLQTERYVRKK